MRIPAWDNSDSKRWKTAADAGVMLRAFREYFGKRYSMDGLELTECHIDRVFFKPGKYVRVIYRLRFRGIHGEDDHWFVGKMKAKARATPEGGSNRTRTISPIEGWLPEDYWPEFGMTLTAFPHDDRLRQLAALLDTSFVTRTAELHRTELGVPADWRCEDLSVRPVKYLPSKRCVIRYDFRWLDAKANPVMKCVFSKSYRDDRSSYVYEALRAVRMNSTHGSYGFVFPRPLLHLRPHHTIWQEAWNGVPLSETIVSDSWDDLFPQLAGSLAAFHSGRLNGLDLQTGPAPAEVLRNAHDDAADILGFFRDEPAELRNVIERLNSMVDGLAKSATPAVPIHGTFKIAQLLIGNGQIAVVDFDSVAIGDPLYDVAEFLASVLALKERHALPASRVVEGVRLFLTEYSKSVAWDCDRNRIHWYAAAFMLAKIHSSLKTLEIETTDQFERRLDVLCSLLPAAIDG